MVIKKLLISILLLPFLPSALGESSTPDFSKELPAESNLTDDRSVFDYDYNSDRTISVENTSTSENSTEKSKKLPHGKCFKESDCLGIDFQEAFNDSELACCDSNGVENSQNLTTYVGFCCYNGTLLNPSNKRKCMTIAILAMSLASCLIVIGFVLFRLNAKYDPRDEKITAFSHLGFTQDKSPPKRSNMSLPVEKPYVSCPLFEESANETSEDEMTSFGKSTNENLENRLAFEMLQEDFEETLKEEEKLMSYDTRYYMREKAKASKLFEDRSFGDAFRPIQKEDDFNDFVGEEDPKLDV